MLSRTLVSVFSCFLFFTVIACRQTQQPPAGAILIDFSKPEKPLVPFWTATGFSPAEIVDRPEMKDVLREVGALPDRGLAYVRPHYLLNLVAVEGISTSSPTYDYAKLDAVLDEIVTVNGFKLIFELMGFPQNVLQGGGAEFDAAYQEQTGDFSTDFDDLTDERQIRLWKKFVAHLAGHLIDRYGKETVRSWYFETTNEPDLDIFWKYDVATFLNYYDACSEGLKAADPGLRFGGPGTANDLQPVFKALLNHCATGTNFFTGETGVRIDFISVHMKDDPYDILKRELATVSYIRENHPQFSDLPFLNDEADPLAGWARDFWWRKGPWYAAFVAQNIDIHQKKLIDSAGVNYVIQSNDHTFLGPWHARTTHALLKDPERPEAYQLIPKPVMTVMGLIAELGDTYVDVDIPKENARYFGVMATRRGKDSLVLMVYNKTDFDPNTHDWDVNMPAPTPTQQALMKEQALNPTLSFRHLPFENFTLTRYQFDDEHTNPYGDWVALGSPEYLTDEEHRQLLTAATPQILETLVGNAGNDNVYNLTLTLPSPAVAFLVLTRQ